MFCKVAVVVFPQATKLPSTLSFVTPRRSTACASTLTKTWSRSVPSVKASQSTCTCTIAKVCDQSFFSCVTPPLNLSSNMLPVLLHKTQMNKTSIAVSQLEVHNITAASATSRSASVDPKTIRNTPDTPALLDTSAASALDQFAQAARLALKMQCVKERLDSVLVSVHPP